MQTGFPFALEDISSWVIRRKDGTVVKYTIVASGDVAKSQKPAEPKVKQASYYGNCSYSGHLSDYCDHAPWPEGLADMPKGGHSRPPVFTNGKISLWIADAPGARKTHTGFDVCIDGGNVLDVPGERDLPDIYGDPKFCAALSRHTINTLKKSSLIEGPRIIKLRWFDRMAPPVLPSFWPALLVELEKMQSKLDRPLRVLTICQGGHGRSGSALVALMMCMTDYTPLDALTHIRALHCARAIESKVQHEYLNLLAKHLGRAENAFDVEQVKSYKDTLASSTRFAQVYKDQLAAGKGAGAAERDGTFC